MLPFSSKLKTPLGAVFILLSALGAGSVQAQPYTPTDPHQVVERLPGRANTPELKKTARLKKQLDLSPNNDAVALDLAQAYFEAAMAVGDPRYIGYARAVFEPRLNIHAMDPNWWFVSGLIKQYSHLFPEAQADFDKALTLDKNHAPSIAWKAALWMVEGRYAQAAQMCEQLKNHTTELAYAGCADFAKAGLGQLQAAYDDLSTQLKNAQNASPAMRLWTLTRLAEMSERLGQTQNAEQHYRQAIQLGLNDQYLLAAHADFLLREHRASEVLTQLRGWEASDVLLLRLVLAAKDTQDAKLDTYRSELDGRFEALRRRGEQLHEQEEARFLLWIENKPKEALEKARHNYFDKYQREPRDMEILLQAAAATRSIDVVKPVHQWLDTTGFEDARLKPWIEKTRGAR